MMPRAREAFSPVPVGGAGATGTGGGGGGGGGLAGGSAFGNGSISVNSLADKLLGTSLGTSPSLFSTLGGPDPDDISELVEEEVWEEGRHGEAESKAAEGWAIPAPAEPVRFSRRSPRAEKELGNLSLALEASRSLQRAGGGERKMIPAQQDSGSASGAAARSRQAFPNQSAPLNVPDWSKILGVMHEQKPPRYDSDEDEEGRGHRLHPHEIVARDVARSQQFSYSLLEGRGSTLKGMRLSQVRNSVLRQTGFITDN